MIPNIFHRHRQPPDDLWVQCSGCHELLYRREFQDLLHTCPRCGCHARLSACERIATLLDPEGWAEEETQLLPGDPLEFISLNQAYAAKLAETQERTGLEEAMVTGTGTIEGLPVRVAVCDFAFLGASMGSVMGEKVARSAERSMQDQRPLLLLTASGGARMHEGIYSLMQMAKTTAVLGRLGRARVPCITILGDPTTGGVTASFASLGDVILAEPGALIGFAGPRVIEQTTKQKLPADAQRPDFLLKHGMIDAIVHRRELRSTLANLLRLYAAPCPEPGDRGQGSGVRERRPLATDPRPLTPDGRPPSPNPHPLSAADAWAVVQRARDSSRPFTLDYLGMVFTEFFELRGDRLFADDAAIVGGLASLDGRTVAVVGHQKGRTTQERMARRFGMARPEGYRKALRIMRLAEKFGFPVISFIDTPGADPSLEAEQRGQAWAIAENLLHMAELRVPLIAVVIGEGGSGGALAIGLGDRLLMLENATYSVVSPEGCASILWNDAALAPQAAAAMKLTATDVARAGIADALVPEPEGGAQADYAQAAAGVHDALSRALHEIDTQFGSGAGLDAPALVAARYAKYRNIGLVIEDTGA